eukprot:SAG11_NODE_2844_length_2914_cov_1.684192_4_plen_115_part_00
MKRKDTRRDPCSSFEIAELHAAEGNCHNEEREESNLRTAVGVHCAVWCGLAGKKRPGAWSLEKAAQLFPPKMPSSRPPLLPPPCSTGGASQGQRCAAAVMAAAEAAGCGIARSA